MYQKLVERKAKSEVIGLGDVGLPVALEYAKKISVIGFCFSGRRIEMMQNGRDPSKVIDSRKFKNQDILVTVEPEILRTARFFKELLAFHRNKIKSRKYWSL